MKKLYMIGGTMGVGKTTVSRQLKHNLPNSVFLDGDWCWDASPFQVTEETKAMVMDKDNCDIKCISLVANEKKLRERLMADVERGIRTEDVIERSLARMPLYQTLNTIIIDTSNKTIPMIVNEITQL